MRGVNKAIVLGNLGADPELRYTQSGSAVANLSIATNERWKDKQTGEQREETEWHRIAMFGPLAEIAGEHLKKGDAAYIEGRIQTRKWPDKDGQDRYTTEIVANELRLLGGRGGESTGAPASGGGKRSDYTQAQTEYAQASGGRSRRPEKVVDDPDDDIPF